MNGSLTTTTATTANQELGDCPALPNGAPKGLVGPFKRFGDIVVSGLTLLAITPLLLVIALLITIFDGVPFLYTHQRVGRGGDSFTLLKFRTMHKDADERLETLLKTDPAAAKEWQEHRKLRHDPRITRLGHFLRRSSLDELPQLLNVLRGDMSLVGPRPIVDEELARFGSMAPAYMAARPGITGLWQISGRNDTNYDGRIALDVGYVQNWSLGTDLAILAQTVPAVLFGKGAY